MRIGQLLFLLLVLFTFKSYGNDGAFFASGNQLIPIQETDISVKKEILKVKKLNNKYIEVTVYYEFFNPSAEKEIIVGFEAVSPEGDVDGTPKKGLHPYMRDFTVLMNDQQLKYEVSHVADSLYNQNGKIKSIDLKTFEGNKSGNYVDFFYVYHFKAKFKKGLNIIKHTYTFDVSSGIDYNYHFDYVLTAANRWANHQIDDFTLIVEMEDFEIFNIAKTFFNNKNEWIIDGVGKVEDVKGIEGTPYDKNALKFIMQKGSLKFQKKNFKPKGELSIYSFNPYIDGTVNQGKDFNLPFSIYMQEHINIDEPISDFQRKVLVNLPYARRGYLFKDKELNTYYRNYDWYIPNPDYVPNLADLKTVEQKWIRKWKKNN